MPGANKWLVPPQDRIYEDPKYPGMLFKSSPTGSIQMQNLPSSKESGGTEYKDFVIGYKQDHPNASTSQMVKAYQEQKARSSGLRYEGLAKARGKDVWDTRTKTWVPSNQFEVNRMMQFDPTRFQSASYARYTDPVAGDKYALQQAKEAFKKVPASQRGASIITSSKLLEKEIPEIVELRYKVEQKGALPESVFKDVNKLNQWLGEKTSDPDLALLRKKVLLLSESLQRIMGSSQGGEWAFEVSKDILDPSFKGEAFEKIAYSHANMLSRLAKEYVNFNETVQKNDFGNIKPPNRGGPKVGTIDGGYIFSGGDPADPKNWKKVK